MSEIIPIFFVAILGVSLTSAHAESVSSSYSLTASAGEYGLSPGMGFKLGYEVAGSGMSDSFGVEGSYTTKWSDRGDTRMVHIDLIVPVTPRERVVPFLDVGPGAISGHGVPGFALGLALGGGVNYFISDTLALRGDLRDMLVVGQKPSANDIECTVGLSWIFGKREWQVEDLEKKDAANVEAPLPSGLASEGRDHNQAASAVKKTVAAEAGNTGAPLAAPPSDTSEMGEKPALAPATAGKGGDLKKFQQAVRPWEPTLSPHLIWHDKQSLLASLFIAR